VYAVKQAVEAVTQKAGVFWEQLIAKRLMPDLQPLL
jgi:hypothetical protein